MDFLKLIYGQRNIIQGLVTGRLPIYTLSVCKTAAYNWAEIYDNEAFKAKKYSTQFKGNNWSRILR